MSVEFDVYFEDTCVGVCIMQGDDVMFETYEGELYHTAKLETFGASHVLFRTNSSELVHSVGDAIQWDEGGYMYVLIEPEFYGVTKLFDLEFSVDEDSMFYYQTFSYRPEDYVDFDIFDIEGF